MTYYPGIDVIEKIKYIFTEYHTKHNNENILNQDLGDLLSQYREGILENECLKNAFEYIEDEN